jgi:hypothetical protein
MSEQAVQPESKLCSWSSSLTYDFTLGWRNCPETKCKKNWQDLVEGSLALETKYHNLEEPELDSREDKRKRIIETQNWVILKFRLVEQIKPEYS